MITQNLTVSTKFLFPLGILGIEDQLYLGSHNQSSACGISSVFGPERGSERRVYFLAFNFIPTGLLMTSVVWGEVGLGGGTLGFVCPCETGSATCKFKLSTMIDVYVGDK